MIGPVTSRRVARLLLSELYWL